MAVLAVIGLLAGVCLVAAGAWYGLRANKRLDFIPQYFTWEQVERFKRCQDKETLITVTLCVSGVVLVVASCLCIALHS